MIPLRHILKDPFHDTKSLRLSEIQHSEIMQNGIPELKAKRYLHAH